MTEIVKETMPIERLWKAGTFVFVKATTEKEAEEKTMKGHLIVEDVILAEPYELDHLEGEAREIMAKRIFDALELVEKNPAMDW